MTKIFNKKALKLLLRIGISLCFILFFFHNTDSFDIGKALMQTNHSVLLIGIFIYLAGQLISAYKWRILAKLGGFNISLAKYAEYYYIGMFFNLFLPTTVGGDVVKSYYLSKTDSNSRKAPAIYSVLADRYTGVLVIQWIGTIAMFSPFGTNVPQPIRLIMLAVSIFISFITLIFTPVLRKISKKSRKLTTLYQDIEMYWNNPSKIFMVFYWSILFHLLIITIHITISSAMGLSVPIWYYFIVYPMSAIAGFIPLSFNGIGPREATYIYFLSLAGVSSSSALVFGIYWFVIVFLASLVGGIFYIREKHIPTTQELDIAEHDIESQLSYQD